MELDPAPELKRAKKSKRGHYEPLLTEAERKDELADEYWEMIGKEQRAEALEKIKRAQELDVIANVLKKLTFADDLIYNIILRLPVQDIETLCIVWEEGRKYCGSKEVWRAILIGDLAGADVIDTVGEIEGEAVKKLNDVLAGKSDLSTKELKKLYRLLSFYSVNRIINIPTEMLLDHSLSARRQRGGFIIRSDDEFLDNVKFVEQDNRIDTFGGYNFVLPRSKSNLRSVYRTRADQFISIDNLFHDIDADFEDSVPVKLELRGPLLVVKNKKTGNLDIDYDHNAVWRTRHSVDSLYKHSALKGTPISIDYFVAPFHEAVKDPENWVMNIEDMPSANVLAGKIGDYVIKYTDKDITHDAYGEELEEEEKPIRYTHIEFQIHDTRNVSIGYLKVSYVKGDEFEEHYPSFSLILLKGAMKEIELVTFDSIVKPEKRIAALKKQYNPNAMIKINDKGQASGRNDIFIKEAVIGEKTHYMLYDKKNGKLHCEHIHESIDTVSSCCQ